MPCLLLSRQKLVPLSNYVYVCLHWYYVIYKWFNRWCYVTYTVYGSIGLYIVSMNKVTIGLKAQPFFVWSCGTFITKCHNSTQQTSELLVYVAMFIELLSFLTTCNITMVFVNSWIVDTSFLKWSYWSAGVETDC